MKITNKWLKEKRACIEGIDWFNSQKETEAVKVLTKLIKEKKLDWANWTICRVFIIKQRVQYAVFAAEQVLHIFEKKYPNDNRPRKAIEAAKKCIKKNTEANRDAASAASAAASAASAAYAANVAAYAAASAAKKQLKLKILNYGLNLLKGG